MTTTGATNLVIENSRIENYDAAPDDATSEFLHFSAAAQRAGLAPSVARHFFKAARFMFGENDMSADEQIYLIQELEKDYSGDPLEAEVHRIAAPTESELWNAIIDRVKDGMTATELYELAARLTRIATIVEDNKRSEYEGSDFSWLSPAKRIERNSVRLAAIARGIQKRRRYRDKVLGVHLFRDPAWEMLLELFCAFSEHTEVSTKGLSIVSGVPMSTALRNMERLEKAKLISRSQSGEDRRVTLVRLTAKGVTLVGRTLARVSA